MPTAKLLKGADNPCQQSRGEYPMNLSRTDIEMTFIRSLSCSGVILAGSQLSPDDRRERIRIAIMKAHMSNRPLPIDPSVTYAQAFQLIYNRPCELRTAERDRYGRELIPQPAANDANDVHDDEHAESGLL
jgi:hypothetical protein